MNSTAWLAAQHNCAQLRSTCFHLSQGTRKSRNLKDLRRYLQVATINCKALLVVKKMDPFVHERELIIVPQFALPGLLTALHLCLGHLASTQLSRVFNKYFSAIKGDDAINLVTAGFSQCMSLRKLPKEFLPQTSTVSPDRPGCQFSTDVVCRVGQKVLVTRDIYSSFTNALLIPDETGDKLRSALLLCTSLLRNNPSIIHVGNAPGFLSLNKDKSLKHKGITLEYGRIKNLNKNSVIDKAIQELELELLKVHGSGAAITDVQLQQTVDAKTKTLESSYHLRTQS